MRFACDSLVCMVHLASSVADRSQPEIHGSSTTEETTINCKTIQVVVLASLAQLLGLVELARSIQIEMKSSIPLWDYILHLPMVLMTEAAPHSGLNFALKVDSLAVGRKCTVCVHTTFFCSQSTLYASEIPA